VTATEATVVRCTKEAGDRTLVFTYVLTGSAADGLHEASVTARVSQGPITVATVPALEPDGDPVTVRLQPGPVTCD
jgi:hypothetical protein